MPDVIVQADAAKLRGAVLNLVDNAVKATAPGDWIQIATTLRPHTGDLAIAVGDSGPGIPAAERQAATDRFSRPGARDADGSGLGLAIVTAVAAAHGGDVVIGESARGGCSVTIRLPATRCSLPEED